MKATRTEPRQFQEEADPVVVDTPNPKKVKTCTKCKVEQPRHHYQLAPLGRDGRRTECNTCRAARMKASRERKAAELGKRGDMTEQDEELELKTAEETVAAAWKKTRQVTYEFSRACNVRHCGADKRSVNARPAGTKVLMDSKDVIRKWFDERVAALGEGDFHARRRRLLSMRITSQELTNMGKKL